MGNFRDMTPERRREISSLGGTSARDTSRSHRWTKQEAASAGRKSGEARRQKRAEIKGIFAGEKKETE